MLSAGLETAEYVHTDDTAARHQGHNGYCTVIGNDLFAYNSRSLSKSRENYLRLLRGPHEDYVLNEYAHSYLIAQQLPQCHLVKLQFSRASVAQGEAAWQAYLQGLEITSLQAVKQVTEAALLGSAISLWIVARFDYSSAMEPNSLPSWFMPRGKASTKVDNLQPRLSVGVEGS